MKVLIFVLETRKTNIIRPLVFWGTMQWNKR